MSIELSSETKSIEVVKEERTWRIEMFTDKGSEYTIKIHRELAEVQDGVLVSNSNKDLELKELTIQVSSVMASAENVAYTDIDGASKTFPIKDFPLLISAYCDKAVEEEKARLAAL